MEVGTHLPAQKIADLLRLSRSPVNEALSLLHEKGVLSREPNRGFFVANPAIELATETAISIGLSGPDAITSAYFRIADDRLKSALPDEVSEQMLKTRYGLTATQLTAVLGRIAQEGWAERKPGYGWQFSAMLTTPDSLMKSYRLRLALEPAALLNLDTGWTRRCSSAAVRRNDICWTAVSRPTRRISCTIAAFAFTSH